MTLLPDQLPRLDTDGVVTFPPPAATSSIGEQLQRGVLMAKATGLTVGRQALRLVATHAGLDVTVQGRVVACVSGLAVVTFPSVAAHLETGAGHEGAGAGLPAFSFDAMLDAATHVQGTLPPSVPPPLPPDAVLADVPGAAEEESAPRVADVAVAAAAEVREDIGDEAIEHAADAPVDLVSPPAAFLKPAVVEVVPADVEPEYLPEPEPTPEVPPEATDVSLDLTPMAQSVPGLAEALAEPPRKASVSVAVHRVAVKREPDPNSVSALEEKAPEGPRLSHEGSFYKEIPADVLRNAVADTQPVVVKPAAPLPSELPILVHGTSILYPSIDALRSAEGAASRGAILARARKAPQMLERLTFALGVVGAKARVAFDGQVVMLRNGNAAVAFMEVGTAAGVFQSAASQVEEEGVLPVIDLGAYEADPPPERLLGDPPTKLVEVPPAVVEGS